MVCKISFCSQFPNILNKAGRITTARRRTQAIAKCFVFHSKNILILKKQIVKKIPHLCFFRFTAKLLENSK